MQVFDKEAFVEARKKSRKVKDRTKRHSSLEPSEVEHLESSMGGVYAVINKNPKKKPNKELSDLLSPNVMAQLTLENTEQIESWEDNHHEANLKSHVEEKTGPRKSSPEESSKKGPRKTSREEKTSGYVQVELPTNHPLKSGQETKELHKAGRVHAEDKKSSGYVQVDLPNEPCTEERREPLAQRKDGPKPAPRQQGYVQLAFHDENAVKKGKVVPDGSPVANSRVDTGKTKFGYSTVVFEKEERNKEFAERKRQNKPPPQLPAKYNGSGMSKNSSDSQLVYSDIDHGKTHQHAISRKHGESAPDLSQSPPLNSGYVNVRFNNAPVVPPRRGVAAIQEESSQ